MSFLSSFAPIAPPSLPTVASSSRQLLGWRAALAAVRNGTAEARVLGLGDSTTVGHGGSTTLTIPQARSYPRRLAQLLGGTPGLANGKRSVSYFDSRWTTPAGWVISEWGCKGWETGSAAGPLVYTPDDGGTYDRFDVFLVKNPGGGTVTITATGGSPVVTSLNSTNGIYKVTVSCPASASASVSIAQSGQVWVLGVEPWHSTNKAVRVGNVGISEYTAAMWNDQGALPNIGPMAMVAAYNPDLTIISLGLNDANAGATPAQFKERMQVLITAVKAVSDVILWIPLPPGPPGTAPVALQAGIRSYVPKYKELATENDIPLADFHTRLNGTYMPGFLNDGYHPNDLGYWEIAAGLSPILIP